MSEPQAQEPMQQAQGTNLDPDHMIGAQRQRIYALTDENTMLVALNSQLISEMRRVEGRLAEFEEKDGGGSSQGAAAGEEADPGAAPGPGVDKQNGRGSRGARGPTPADAARAARRDR